MVAVDISERMVELARARRVDARVGDVQKLPFEDETFDSALAGCRRSHVEELRRLVASWPTSPFDDESGPPLLRRHFAHVEEHDLGGWIEFPNAEAVRAYVAASRQLFPADLPPGAELPLRVRRAPVMYVATR